MDPRIEKLKSTTFFGHRLTRKQIAGIRETVETFPALSRTELGHTICEHLRWQTPGGNNRIQLALRLLEALEGLDIVQLPPLREGPKRGKEAPPRWTSRSDPRPPVEDSLADLTPLQLQAVCAPEKVEEWKEWLDRYHYLGYRHPFGPHLRYWLLDRRQRKLGCMLFAYGSKTLACRDEWIGWQGQAHRKQLDLVLGQARFLLFPWVRVRNLASKALALALRQLPADWERLHGRCPVLVETFVDLERFHGTCYRAANWQLLGTTKGRKSSGRAPAQPPKGVFVRPLHPRWRQILLDRPRPSAKPARRSAKEAASEPPRVSNEFVQLWRGVVGTLTSVANAWDRTWLKRQRSINTLLVMMFVYRLALAPDRQRYALTLSELWEQCRQLGIALPQARPVAASSICAARSKVGEEVFRTFHRALLEQARQAVPERFWHGHRVFAVDGSKLNLPRPLLDAGFSTPGPEAQYPQGLLSCLYQLQAGLPVDFDLLARADERAAARGHLAALQRGDAVVYDQGYYSFRLLHAHARRGVHAVFRLERNANDPFQAFADGDRDDALLLLAPGADLRRRHPEEDLRPCRLRLVRYTVADSPYALATTLLDPRRYPVGALSKLYHGRWSIEELHEISKQLPDVEAFHGQSERTVRQELYARFNLIAMMRLSSNRSEAD